jgi:sugar lactone lactonase YvrE
VQTLTQYQTNSARKTFKFMTTLLCASGLSFASAQAQVPSVVASSHVALTPSSAGGVYAGPAVTDKCGNVYVNESGNIVQFAAGTGTQTVVSANTNGYGGPSSIAIDPTKTFLYFPAANQWYSSVWSYVNVSTCTPGGATAFPATGVSYLFSYYFGTANVMAVDGYGDVFFVPTANSNNSIAEISCGSTPGTSCNGAVPTGANAKIIASKLTNYPTSLAADSAGDVFYTDGSANVYELVPPYTAAPVTVGSGFTQPIGVTFDPAGNLYVADSNGYNGNIYYTTTFTSVLYKIPLESGALNPAHQYIVANNLGIAAPPAIDGSGNVYYTAYPPSQYQYLNEVIVGAAQAPNSNVAATSSTSLNYVFNASTTPAKISVNAGTKASTVFANASSSSCAAGTTYTAGQSCSINLNFTPSIPGLQTGAVVLADATGAAINIATLSGVGIGAAATVDPGTQVGYTGAFTKPQGAAVDASGNLYVADPGTNTVLAFAAGSTAGVAVSTGTITLSAPSAVAIDPAGDIFICDTGNNRIVEIPVVKGVLANASTVVTAITVKSPGGLVFDGYGDLYIADTGNNRVLFIPQNGGVLNAAAAQTYGSGFSAPLAVALDSNNDVFVADTGNNAVQELVAPAAGGKQIKVVGGLNGPSALATDAAGSLYVVDKGNASVYRFPNFSGTLGAKSLVGGTVANPAGLAIDAAGNLYITDNVNGVVAQINRLQGTLPFGSWNVGTTSTPLTASISDGGNASLTFPNPDTTASGATTAGFAVTGDNCATGGTVVPGGSCSIVATFTPPTTELNATETLKLLSNGTNGTANIVLVGTGAHITPSTLSLVLTSPTGTINAGVSASFTATVGTGSNTAVPSGNIKFFVNGSLAGTVTVNNGAASITLPNGLPAGTVAVSAVYSGDPLNYSGSSTSLNETVIGLGDSLSLAITTPYTNPQSTNDKPSNATGPTVPLIATLVPSGKVIPGGTVSFYSGTTLLGLASVLPASGGVYQATLNETALRALTGTVGEGGSIFANYNLTATYSGDTYYVPANSNSVPLTIVGAPTTQAACATSSPATCSQNTTGASFTITPTNPTLTIQSSTTPGPTSGTVLLSITSYGGWQGVVNFTCAGLPAYATCAPYPGAPLVAASTPTATVLPTQVQFIINTNVPPVVPNASGFIWWVAGISGLAFLFARRRLKKLGVERFGTYGALVLLLIASVGGATGCGNTNNSVKTPVGTSKVTVTVSAAQTVVPLTSPSTVALKDANSGSFAVALTIQ